MSEWTYLQKNSRYYSERALLSVISKHEFKEIIQCKWKELQYIKDWLLNEMKKVMIDPNYCNLDDLSKYFTEQYVYIMFWWQDLEDISLLVTRLERLFNQKFCSNVIVQDKNYITKDLIDSVKNIPIDVIISQYLGLSLSDKGYIKCPFHNDKWPSLKVYVETNSFYCYGCRAWGTPIEFAAKLYNLSNKEAISQLKSDFIF